MKVECTNSHLQTLLKDTDLRKIFLEFGVCEDQILLYPRVDAEIKAVIEYAFSAVITEGYLPLVLHYPAPEGWEQDGHYAEINGIEGFYLVRFPDTSQDYWEVFASLEEAEEFLDQGYTDYLNEFEADRSS